MEKNPTLHATVPKAVPQKREVWDAETIFLALDICDDARLKLAINPSFRVQYANRRNSRPDLGLRRYFSEKHRSRNGIHHD